MSARGAAKPSCYWLCAIGLAACGSAPEASAIVESPGCELYYKDGHGDWFFTGSEDSAAPTLRIRTALQADEAERLYDPSQVCIVVPPAALELAASFGGAPAGEAYAFLGVPAGESFWLLPAVARQGLPWLGVSTENVPATQRIDVVAQVSAPKDAQWASWNTNALGAPTALLSTYSGLLHASFAAGRHLHFNWSFSKSGVYRVELSVTARNLTGDSTAQSTQVPLTFWVQP